MAGTVFIGGVQASYACLQALCELGQVPRFAVGYSPGWASRASGGTDLSPLAEQYGFELVTTRDVNDSSLVSGIEYLNPDLVWVIGWSQIVKPRLLHAPRHGCVGIHPTRLPQGRGRAAIPWTILKDLRTTASTMFFLNEGMDDGPVVGRVEFPVAERETALSLYRKHLQAHVQLVREHCFDLVAGRVEGFPQDKRVASYWPRRVPADGRIDWTQPVVEIDRLVRAVTRPYPGAFTDTRQGRVIIWRAEPELLAEMQASSGEWLSPGLPPAP